MTNIAARVLSALAAILFFAGCQHSASRPARGRPKPAEVAPETLAPSPRLIIGRIVAVDSVQGFALIELAPDAPGAALVEGAELTSRTLELQETARLQGSRHVRGRTFGTKIVSGQPTRGDEVVWLAP